MHSASALRLQIESSLERRFPAALSPLPRTGRESAPTGIPAIDRLLGGGLPVGAISEVCGPASSGRTSLALAFLAARTQQDRVCAWVDPSDVFDAESAAANGVILRQLLWVRPSRLPTPQKSAWSNSRKQAAESPVFSCLDRSLRATDLLLQAGGFSAIVLDLGSISASHGQRIPLATWFRFRQAADRTGCSLLVLAQQSLAQSSADVVLQCTALTRLQPSSTVLTTYAFKVSSGRQRFSTSLSGQRKPPESTWSATSPAQREASA